VTPTVVSQKQGLVRETRWCLRNVAPTLVGSEPSGRAEPGCACNVSEFGVWRVELEGIEPSSARWSLNALRPFPCLWLAVASLPGQAGTRPNRWIFLQCQRSLPAVSGLSLPSTTASGDRLRWSGPVRHRCLTMTLFHLMKSGGESEIVRSGVSLVAPFLESEQLRSHVKAS